MFGDVDEGVVEEAGGGDVVAAADGCEDGVEVVVELGEEDG